MVLKIARFKVLREGNNLHWRIEALYNQEICTLFTFGIFILRQLTWLLIFPCREAKGHQPRKLRFSGAELVPIRPACPGTFKIIVNLDSTTSKHHKPLPASAITGAPPSRVLSRIPYSDLLLSPHLLIPGATFKRAFIEDRSTHALLLEPPTNNSEDV
jgi:hypothetical protein